MKKWLRYLTGTIGAAALGITFGLGLKALNNNSIDEPNLDNISQDNVVHPSFLDDGIIKIGLVSDIEGSIRNAQIAANRFADQNLDAIIIAGDTYEDEQRRRNPLYPNSTDNVQEMVDGITPYAGFGVPVYVIQGNHESINLFI